MAIAALALAGGGPSAAVGAVDPVAAARAEVVLVKIDASAGRADRAAVRDALDATSVEKLPAGWRAYTLPDPISLADARKDLALTDADRVVELARQVRITATPNDPLFPVGGGGYQWGLSNTASWVGGVAGVDIGALAAWSQTSPSAAPTIVAVLDTGLEVSHPDLAGRIATNLGEIAGNGIDDDANGFVDDATGWDFNADNASVFDNATDDRHGTHVAGIIAANRDNGIGIAGVASNARILPVKFIGAGGTGWNSDAISGLQYAVNRGAKVVNASFGGETYDPALCDAVAWAASQGTLVVAAAGNNGRNLDGFGMWPAKCPEPSLLTVAAITHSETLASFSNYSSTSVDLGAPGANISSTVPGGYGFMSGTSMATPFAAGVAAAVLGDNPALTPAQVHAALLDGATPMSALATTTLSGRRLSFPGALAVASGTPVDAGGPTAPTLATPTGGSFVASRRPTFSWQAAQDPSGIAGYRLYIDGAVVAGLLSGTSFIPTTDLAAGPHSWRVEARDVVGNATTTPEATFVVDTGLPTEPILVSPGDAAALPVGAARFRWKASDDLDSGIERYEILIDDQIAMTTRATDATVAVKRGPHTWTVRAVDRAGNTQSAASQSFMVTAAARGNAPKIRARRIGRSTILEIRVVRASRLALSITNSAGRSVGELTVKAPAGKSTFALPTSVSRRLKTGRFTFSVRDTTTLATSFSRLTVGARR